MKKFILDGILLDHQTNKKIYFRRKIIEGEYGENAITRYEQTLKEQGRYELLTEDRKYFELAYNC